jgi:hypothetical protein
MRPGASGSVHSVSSVSPSSSYEVGLDAYHHPLHALAHRGGQHAQGAAAGGLDHLLGRGAARAQRRGDMQHMAHAAHGGVPAGVVQQVGDDEFEPVAGLAVLVDRSAHRRLLARVAHGRAHGVAPFQQQGDARACHVAGPAGHQNCLGHGRPPFATEQ